MYIIKKIYDATAANNNFANRHIEYIEGKNGIFCICDTYPNLGIWHQNDAIRCLKSCNDAYVRKPTKSFYRELNYAEAEMKDGFYTIKLEIIEI